MARRPAPLPASLGDVFTTAQARAAGLTPQQLRRLPAPFRGVRCRRAPETLDERCRAAAVVLPHDAAFCGDTAAALHGLWLPADAGPHPLEVIVPPGRDEPRIQGVRSSTGAAQVLTVRGLRVCSVPDVVAQLADRLGLLDLVVLVESTAPWRSGQDLERLEQAVRPGRRGVRRLRRALALARAGSGSPPETVARLWLVDAGLPEPERNGRIVLPDRVVHGDLVWREQRVVAEYHGAYHFETAQQRLGDFDRIAALRRAGWAVVELARGTLTVRRRRDAFVDEVAGHLGVHALPPGLRGRTLRDVETGADVPPRAG